MQNRPAFLLLRIPSSSSSVLLLQCSALYLATHSSWMFFCFFSFVLVQVYFRFWLRMFTWMSFSNVFFSLECGGWAFLRFILLPSLLLVDTVQRWCKWLDSNIIRASNFEMEVVYLLFRVAGALFPDIFLSPDISPHGTSVSYVLCSQSFILWWFIGRLFILIIKY